jgi:predicted transcriptional regulator
LQTQSSKRNHLHVLADILDVCRIPQSKIQVMCKADISYRLLDYCLKQLRKQHMIKFSYRTQACLTTEKGLRFLQRLTEPNAYCDNVFGLFVTW